MTILAFFGDQIISNVLKKRLRIDITQKENKFHRDLHTKKMPVTVPKD